MGNYSYLIGGCMSKIDRTVLKETVYVATVAVILSVLMQAVFIVLNKWNLTVLFGNLLGTAACIGNFLLMGITVQKAVVMEEKDAKNLVKLSQSGRLCMLFCVALIGHLVPIFNLVAVVIPFVFPRIAVMLRASALKKGE